METLLSEVFPRSYFNAGRKWSFHFEIGVKNQTQSNLSNLYVSDIKNSQLNRECIQNILSLQVRVGVLPEFCLSLLQPRALHQNFKIKFE